MFENVYKNDERFFLIFLYTSLFVDWKSPMNNETREILLTILSNFHTIQDTKSNLFPFTFGLATHLESSIVLAYFTDQCYSRLSDQWFSRLFQLFKVINAMSCVILLFSELRQKHGTIFVSKQFKEFLFSNKNAYTIRTMVIRQAKPVGKPNKFPETTFLFNYESE